MFYLEVSRIICTFASELRGEIVSILSFYTGCWLKIIENVYTFFKFKGCDGSAWS